MNHGVLGIFVGGRARRMGGFPKGLLPRARDGESILRHLVAVAGEVGMETVLVGDAAPYSPEVSRGMVVLADRPASVGPLGGLGALLAHAGERRAVAVACDMPFVTAALLRRLRDAEATAPIVAMRRDAFLFEPFLARYDAARVAPVLAAMLDEGGRSFQQLFARIAVEPWVPSPEEHAAWTDWDAPDDLPPWARRARG